MSSLIYQRVGKFRLIFLAAALCAGFHSEVSFSQQQGAFASHVQAAKGGQWVAGPARVSLGTTAELYVPAGFRFADPDGARILLQADNNPIPKNLKGIIMPESHDWMAIVSFEDIGYIKDAQKERLDPAAILETIRHTIDRQNQAMGSMGGALIGSPEWELKPSFTLLENKLEYAVRAENSGKVGVNHYIDMLGRRGVLALTGVYKTTADFDSTRLENIAAGITLNKGERYTDYQSGDRVSRFTLAQLVADEPSNSIWLAVWDQAKGKGLWAGVGLALAFAGWRLTALGVNSRKRSLRVVRSNGAARPATAMAATSNGGVHAGNGNANGNGNGVGHGATDTVEQIPATAKVQVRIPIENGKPAKNNKFKRRKQFSYHAFYSDMVMSLTRCNYVGGFGAFAPENSEDSPSIVPIKERPLAARSPAAPEPEKPTESSSMLVQETARLIESQQKLIEGQRKLIEEQTKLIQEKCKLLDVESRVLEKQADLFGDHELL
jgi:uncharacterized membrane-anchored protein